MRLCTLTALALTTFAAAPTLPAAESPIQPESAVVAARLDDEKDERPAIDDYDLGKNGLAIDGYDPVAYFPDFGGKATKGSKKITARHRGVLYRFASEANKKAFLADPERFEPMYGGWCAWAMYDGQGSKTEPSPKSFTVEDDRLYLFYDGFWGDTRKSWNKKGGAPKLASEATRNWKRISGEAPRPKPEPTPDGSGGGGR